MMKTYISVIKQQIKNLEYLRESVSGIGCTFWACNARPDNNREEAMVTCSHCRTIIRTTRVINKLKTLL